LRIKISFSALSKNGFMLPMHYNYLVQAFIYRNLSRHIARFVHDRGYQDEKRRPGLSSKNSQDFGMIEEYNN